MNSIATQYVTKHPYKGGFVTKYANLDRLDHMRRTNSEYDKLTSLLLKLHLPDPLVTVQCGECLGEGFARGLGALASLHPGI